MADGVHSGRRVLPGEIGRSEEYAEILDPATRALALPPLSRVTLQPGVREARIWFGFGVVIPHQLVRITDRAGEVRGDVAQFWELARLGHPTEVEDAWVRDFRTELVHRGCEPIRRVESAEACWVGSNARVDWAAVLERLDSLGIWTLPSQSDLPPDSVLVFDGWGMVIEVQRDGVYRSYLYENPGHHERPEARIAEAIGQVIRDVLDRILAPE